MNQKEFNSKKTWNLGIKRYSLSNKDIDNNKKNNIDLNEKKYPSGVIPFIFILIIFLSLFFIAYYATQLSWQNSLSIASTISFLFSLMWFLARVDINYKTKYSINKISRKLKINRLKVYEPYNDKNYAINNIENNEEYHNFLKIRVKKTAIFFYITISLHFLLFIIFLFIVIYVK